MFGVALGSPLSYETFRECVHPDDRALVESAWQAALRGAPYDIEHRILASGAPKWVHERAELEFDDDGALRSGFGTVQDITERKRAQEAVRASEERFRTMFESSAVAIAQLDLETGSIEKVNQRFADLIGRPAAELEGGDYAALLRAAERPQASAGIQAAKAGKLKGDFRWVQTFLRADGSVAETEVFGTVLQDSAARPVAATLIIVDVTERNLIVRELAASRVVSEEAKAAAEEASRAKDHFLAVLSHELRTPLSPVLTGISLLEREGLSAHGRHIVQVIRRNVELEAHLIDDLLDLTRIARGRIELELERVDVCTVIDRAVEVCRPDIEARRLHFGVDYGPRPHMVDVDPARLQQVLWNLLKNAIKFTPKNGCVGLRCSRPQDGELLLEVNDSGIGIESAAIPTIFDAFVREDRKGRHPYGGLGLGLAISKSLVLLHGGRIEAESEGSDKGATFRVYLPLATLDTAAGNERHRLESAASTAETTMPLRVLLVEDHGDTAETMVAVLSLVGHEVATAGDAATAMGLLERESFDLLISDLGLPDLSGIELVQRLRATGCTVPAIALSGYGLESDILRSREAGFAAHLVKPVDPSRLFEVMERVARSAG
jgi:two-component system CheB/CheR fusion protein